MADPNPAPVDDPNPPAPPAADPPANDTPPAGDPPADPPPSDEPPADDLPPTDDPPAALPDNWRELAAGGDDDALKLLKRYGSLNGVAKALVEKDKLIRSGKIKRDMPDPKDEKAMAEWRKDQGIPPDPTGYELPDTVTKRLVDEDKPILSSFTEFAHSKNLPPAAVNAAAEWYVEMQEKASEQQTVTDTSHHEECEDALRDNWSRDEFKGNLALAKRFVADAGGIGDDWTEARLPDGRKLGSIPEFVMWASDRGREVFGDSAFTSADSEAKHTSRKAQIETIMKTDINKYWSEGLNKEYDEIIAREQKRR
jgi:hypothetical protein